MDKYNKAMTSLVSVAAPRPQSGHLSEIIVYLHRTLDHELKRKLFKNLSKLFIGFPPHRMKTYS